VSLGAPQLAQIPLDQIDHVEVVNGNVSALYGSGAIGGVVQVFTKDGGDHPPRFNFSVGYGSYHTQTQQAGVNGALDKDGNTTFSISLALERRRLLVAQSGPGAQRESERKRLSERKYLGFAASQVQRQVGRGRHLFPVERQ
jgi:Outer membrane cobalamin receptor protein